MSDPEPTKRTEISNRPEPYKSDPVKFDSVFITGLAASAALVGIAIFLYNFPIAEPQVSRLFVCSGLAILFGSFGSRATVEYKYAVLTGSAAIAFALFYLLGTLNTKTYVQGQLSGGDLSRAASVDFGGADGMYGGVAEGTNRFDFIVAQDRERESSLSLTIDFPEDEKREGEPEEIEFGLLPADINNYVRKNRDIDWRFDRDALKIIEVGSNITISAINAETQIRTITQRDQTTSDFFGFPSAYAQENTRPLSDIISDLESESAIIRRSARDELSTLPFSNLPAVMDAFRANEASYRVRLGVLVGLTEILRTNPDDASLVSAYLSDGDVSELTRAISDNDQTVRIYATEFLYDLKDIRTIAPALTALESKDTSYDAKYLNAFVLAETAQSLPEGERQELSGSLMPLEQSLGPQAWKLLSPLTDQ